MSDKIILCRWPVDQKEGQYVLCCKDVVTGQEHPFCKAHLERLPLWPE